MAEAIRSVTETIGKATETIRNATKSIRNATKLIRNATKSIRNATKLIRNATKLIRNATKLIRNATLSIVFGPAELQRAGPILVKAFNTLTKKRSRMSAIDYEESVCWEELDKPSAAYRRLEIPKLLHFLNRFRNAAILNLQ